MNRVEEEKKLVDLLRNTKAVRIRIIHWSNDVGPNCILNIAELMVNPGTYWQSPLIANGTKLAAFVKHALDDMFDRLDKHPNSSITLEEVNREN